MDFKYYSVVNDDFRMLSDELNKELQTKFGKKQEKYQQYNLLVEIKDIIICYDDDAAVGCASMKFYDNESYEIKRVFLKKSYRGKGISKRLIEEIERTAKEKGIKRLILETGEGLVAAMNLYKRMGYTITENYGQYKDMPESICMEKVL